MSEPLTAEEIAFAGRDEDRLADLYVRDAPTVAQLCDETLDRSGALLGRVRDAVRGSGRSGGYPRATLDGRQEEGT